MPFLVVSKHAAECGGECSLTGETYRAGLASVLQVSCEECTEMFSIPSWKHMKTSDCRHWEVNLGAVLVKMMMGGDASCLATTMVVIGVPSMSKQTFTTMEWACLAEMEKHLVLCRRWGKTDRNWARQKHDDHLALAKCAPQMTWGHMAANTIPIPNHFYVANSVDTFWHTKTFY